MRKEHTLTKKLAAYSALATSILLGKESANAQILYTDLDPDAETSLPGNYILDLNNDGISDFKFNLIGLTAIYGNQMRVMGYSDNSIERDLSNFPGIFQSYAYANVVMGGNPIGGSASFYGQEIMATYYTFYLFGNFANTVDQFMGVKLVLNSNAYYGWVRLSVNATCNKLTISDYAVDTVANESILAGDKCGNYSNLITTTITPLGPTSFCAEGTVQLMTDSISGGSYEWMVNNTVINGADNYIYTADSVGEYIVVVTTAAGCVDTSNSVAVEVFPNPPAPGITQSGNTLTSTPSDAYQWYFNSAIIPGATSQSYDPPQGGTYTVLITDSNGCSNQSGQFIFIPVGVQDIDPDQIAIVAADNIVAIQLKGERYLDAELKIFDALGNEVYVSNLNSKNIHVDLNHLPGGTYILRINKNSQQVIQKIVVQ